jgi:hypothetical protein
MQVGAELVVSVGVSTFVPHWLKDTVATIELAMTGRFRRCCSTCFHRPPTTGATDCRIVNSTWTTQ